MWTTEEYRKRDVRCKCRVCREWMRYKPTPKTPKLRVKPPNAGICTQCFENKELTKQIPCGRACYSIEAWTLCPFLHVKVFTGSYGRIWNADYCRLHKRFIEDAEKAKICEINKL